MNDPECVAALREEAGVGPVVFWRLLERFGTAEAILAGAVQELQRVRGVGDRQARRISEAAGMIHAVRRRIDCERQGGIFPLTAFDPGYPGRLRRLADAPPLLYARGDPCVWAGPCAAVVGTHRASQVGEEAAAGWGRELARNGIVVVSGLAAGIDAAGHEGALEGGGQTVAVLGSGLDRISPRRNASLAERIAGSGALLSEYPGSAPASVGRLIARNRIVAGLSDLILVVEAHLSASGPMHAVRRGLDAGVPIFVVQDPRLADNRHLAHSGFRDAPREPDIGVLAPFLFGSRERHRAG